MTVAAMWIYVHLISLPAYILDALYYRLPLSAGCVINRIKTRAWNQTANIMNFNFPFFFIISAYPIIWWKWRQVGQVRNRKQPPMNPENAAAERIGRGHSLQMSKTSRVTGTIAIFISPPVRGEQKQARNPDQLYPDGTCDHGRTQKKNCCAANFESCGNFRVEGVTK